MRIATGLLVSSLTVFTVGFASADATGPDAVKFDDGKVAASISGAAGNAEEGRNVFKNRKLGNCLACHANADQSKELFHGEVGPSVDGAGDRWTKEELRAIVVDSKMVFGEQTVMPGFYSLKVGKNVADKFKGKTILTAQQVEDVVAYLTTLKE